MLTILFKILSILGIVLLILVGIAVVVILLVLFFPVCYKVSGKKNAEELLLTVRVQWLFGLLRLSYDYPDPGKLLIKLLSFTLYDSSAERPVKNSGTPQDTSIENAAPMSNQGTVTEPDSVEGKAESSPLSEAAGKVPPQPPFETREPETEEKKETFSGKTAKRLYGLLEKIRYTVRKICAKIKNILQNIAFYKNLWNDPDTQGLMKHAGKRLGYIIKRLRPRKLTITAAVGTGSPDTTGYLYGIYGMFLPKLGKGICITPDFEQAILEGAVKASGHFTVACVLFHSLRLILDRRLRQLRNTIRQYQKTQNK